MQIRLAKEIETDSIVDGEGIRSVIWTQGCSHNCLGCHNPETHNFNEGFLIDVEELKEQIKNLSYQDGITLSGGDPFFQVEAVLEIAKYAKSIDLNIWCYTGFKFEQLLQMSKTNELILELLNNIDVLVDDKFILAERSLNLLFKGSRNQRVINVRKSLKLGKVSLIKKYNQEKQFVPQIKPKSKYTFV